MRHKTTQTVFDYFNRIRDGKPAPLRADIDPSDLKTVLPDVFILETARDGTPLFRLAGTRVCAILGRELRGEKFNDLWHAPNRHKMRLAIEAVLANQAPLTVKIRSLADEEDDGDLEMLLMPLCSRPGVCDRLFGSLVDLSTPRLIGERDRVLMAETLTFAVTDEPMPERQAIGAEHEGFSFSATRLSEIGKRILHLKVLDGGRKD